MIQPGFIDVKYPTNAIDARVWFASNKKDAFWDGTFNQPTLPLADRLHKDARRYW